MAMASAEATWTRAARKSPRAQQSDRGLTSMQTHPHSARREEHTGSG